jgi:hypothetical protein
MKKLIIFSVAIGMTGAAFAGCGDKIPVEGKLSEYDAEKKVLKVGSKEITLAASAEIKGEGGASVEIKDLMEKEVLVSTDKHTGKGESVTLVAKEEKEPKEKPAMKSNVLAESQDWTNSDGKTITAAVQKVEGGKVYFLMDGKVIPYDVTKLSQETIAKLKEIVAAAKP